MQRSTAQHETAITIPDGIPSWITPELMAETVETWQPYYNHPLTPQEIADIIQNIGQLFDVMGDVR